MPELAVTISKWLETTKPHLTENEFAKTKFLAENFVSEAEPFQVPKTFLSCFLSLYANKQDFHAACSDF